MISRNFKTWIVPSACLLLLCAVTSIYARWPTSLYGRPGTLGRSIASGDAVISDCSDPLNSKSIFFPRIPDNSKLPIFARVTVLKPIEKNEREHRAKGDAMRPGGAMSLLVRVEEVLRGNIPASEVELDVPYMCVDGHDYFDGRAYAPGVSGIVAANRLVDTGAIFKTAQQGPLLTLQIYPRFTAAKQ